LNIKRLLEDNASYVLKRQLLILGSINSKRN